MDTWGRRPARCGGVKCNGGGGDSQYIARELQGFTMIGCAYLSSSTGTWLATATIGERENSLVA